MHGNTTPLSAKSSLVDPFGRHVTYLRLSVTDRCDFLVAEGGKPWFLVEVKQSDQKISKTLDYFQRQLEVPLAFQVVLDMEYVNADCFAKPRRQVLFLSLDRQFLNQHGI